MDVIPRSLKYGYYTKSYEEWISTMVNVSEVNIRNIIIFAKLHIF